MKARLIEILKERSVNGTFTLASGKQVIYTSCETTTSPEARSSQR